MDELAALDSFLSQKGYIIQIIFAASTLATLWFIHRGSNLERRIHSAALLREYKDLFFHRYREIYIEIHKNYKLKTRSSYEGIKFKEGKDRSGNEISVKANVLNEMLNDLEMVCFLTKTKTLDFKYMFELLGPFMLIMQKDQEILDEIGKERENNDKTIKYFENLTQMMDKCYKYHHRGYIKRNLCRLIRR